MHALLAARSNFSIGESILSIERLVDAGVKAGATAIALTDTMTVSGMIDLTNRCKKQNVKPIIGCRIRLVDDHTWRKPPKKEGKEKAPTEYFLTYYVLSERGMIGLFRLLSLANDEAHFYNNAKLSFSDLYNEIADMNADDAAIASSDVYSVFHHKDALSILEKIRLSVSVYVTLTPINTPLFDTLNAKAIEAVRDHGFKPLVSRPICYDKGEADAAEVMGAICSNTPLSSMWNKSTAFRDLYPMTKAALTLECGESIKRLLKRGANPAETNTAFQHGLQNIVALTDSIKYEWKKQAVSLPKMAPDEFAEVVAKCKIGWAKRLGNITFGYKPDPTELEVYKTRLVYELGVLKTLNFGGYFLLVEDVVSYAKSVGILVGPGRGSIGGSLVAFLMGITDCDPIRFGLLFERFINPDRLDLPDADLDFMSERRHEIVAYLVQKYGAERVAGVTNFGTLGPASAIRDVGKMFGLDEREYACSKFTPKLHGAHVKLEVAAEQVAEIGSYRDKFPGIWDVSLKLEGVMRNLGQHASGIVVGGCDLRERAVIEHRKGDESVVNWDKRIVEDQGLIKLDVLGLQTLDIIDLASKYIRERHSKRVNLTTISLDDEKVLTNFAQGLTVGCFQFESAGMRRLIRELGKDGTITFDDITAATALYRPGPMESGMMDSYWKRKQGLEATTYDHPLLEDVLKATFGVYVYQEQVMRASRVIAGYSASNADKLRKIMGKKLPAEMAKERGTFVDGCIKTIGCLPEWAEHQFDKIAGFAGYGFNKSHSVTYTMISYQAMYLKTYFPVEFYAATLSMVKEDKLGALLADAERFGIKVEAPEINTATGRFEILTDEKLMIPFTRIKGLSANAAKAIVEARTNEKGATVKFTSQSDFVARVNKRLINVAKQAILENIGSFAAIEPTHAAIDSPSRLKYQREFIPGLITGVVPVNREMSLEESDTRRLEKVYNVMLGAVVADCVPVRPYIGKFAQFMIVFDAPSPQEEAENMMFMSKPSRRPFALERVQEAMDEADIRPEQAFWTAMIKRPKAGKSITPEELKMFQPYFHKELSIVKPPIIVLMGATTVRTFLPDFKGRASEEAGKIMYDARLDANLVIGFGPGEIWHDADKQLNLNAVFASVSQLIS
jgi:DNA polymerase-3 subunit alpha